MLILVILPLKGSASIPNALIVGSKVIPSSATSYMDIHLDINPNFKIHQVMFTLIRPLFSLMTQLLLNQCWSISFPVNVSSVWPYWAPSYNVAQLPQWNHKRRKVLLCPISVVKWLFPLLFVIFWFHIILRY